MEMCSTLFCQFYSQSRTLVASLLTAYLRMMFYSRIITVFGLGLSHIAIDDIRTLAMGHHRQPQFLCLLEYTYQRLVFIYEHISGTGTHKEFDTRHMMPVQPTETLHIVIGSSIEEAIVNVAFFCSQLTFISPYLQVCSLRNGIRHLQIRSHATVCSSLRFALDVSLTCQSRLTEMDMVIYDSWQNKTPRSIHYMFVGATGCLSFKYLCNNVTINNETALKRASLIDYGTVFY